MDIVLNITTLKQLYNTFSQNLKEAAQRRKPKSTAEATEEADLYMKAKAEVVSASKTKSGE